MARDIAKLVGAVALAGVGVILTLVGSSIAGDVMIDVVGDSKGNVTTEAIPSTRKAA